MIIMSVVQLSLEQAIFLYFFNHGRAVLLAIAEHLVDVCDKDNVSYLRTLLRLHSVSNFLKNGRVKVLDGLLDSGTATLMRIIALIA